MKPSTVQWLIGVVVLSNFAIIALTGSTAYLYGKLEVHSRFDGFYPMMVKMYDQMLQTERNK